MLEENVKKILEGYPCINEYYLKHIPFLVKKGHPLICLIIKESRYLGLLNGWLKNLDSNSNVEHLIKKSRNSADFCSIMSEFKVASFLKDKADEIEIITANNSSPDFKIKISDVTITIEVKKIVDKYESKKGNITYPDPSENLFEINDISTIFNATVNSINKGQFYSNIPHVIIFDCGPGIHEDEFEDVLHSRKAEAMSCYNNGKLTGHGCSLYDGLFFKKEGKGNFSYSCLSGVVAFFEGTSVSAGSNTTSSDIKEPRKVFFGNPNAESPIDQGIIISLGFEIPKTNNSSYG